MIPSFFEIEIFAVHTISVTNGLMYYLYNGLLNVIVFPEILEIVYVIVVSM